MTIYADNEFYVFKYKPKPDTQISAAEFDYYARQATQRIKQFTGNNVDENDIPECVKMCCCEIAELLAKSDKQDKSSGGKSAESVQGWSVNYESREQARLDLQAKINSSVYTWLSGTGLLYRGVR